MSSVEFINPRDTAKVFEFVRDLENGTEVTRLRLELDVHVSLADLLKALAPAGLVISTLHGGVQLIHRAPTEAA